MSTGLQPVDLTGAMVGTTGSIDLTQVLGPGGISYAQGSMQTSIPTLRLHNESNCGLFCSFNNSGQSFNLPAGGWSDCYPKSSDSSLNFTVLYTLSGPGVTLLLATYYFPGEPVPAITTLGNSPIGGGNVSTNFSELINTGNNPLSTLINVQPNDATAPTWTADNSGNLIIKSDNGGVLTQLLQLIAGASPEVVLASTNILTHVLGMLEIDQVLTANGGINVSTLRDNAVGAPQIALDNSSPQVQIANTVSVGDQIDIGTGSVTTLTGSAGGTATLYQPFAGTGYKKCLLYLNNFRTQLSAQFMPIPVPFTTTVNISSGNIGNSANIAGLSFEKSNVLQTLEIVSSLAVGGGTPNAETVLYGMSLATCANGLDLIVFPTGGGASMTGLVIMEGI